MPFPFAALSGQRGDVDVAFPHARLCVSCALGRHLWGQGPSPGPEVLLNRSTEMFQAGNEPGPCRAWIPMYTFTSDTAAGVTPGMRLAWPRVRGRTRCSFSCISRESPLTFL